METVEEIKHEVDIIKKEVRNIEEHCCNVELIREAIEARIRTNIALDSISQRIQSLETKDQEVAQKIDNLYRVLYIGMGGLLVFETFILPNILTALSTGG